MNSANPRRKRVKPERHGPIRNTLAPNSTPPVASCAAGPADAAGTPPAAETGPGDVLRETLECGVRTAYTVINEYLRRGYDAASGNRTDWNGGVNMSNE